MLTPYYYVDLSESGLLKTGTVSKTYLDKDLPIYEIEIGGHAVLVEDYRGNLAALWIKKKNPFTGPPLYVHAIRGADVRSSTKSRVVVTNYSNNGELAVEINVGDSKPFLLAGPVKKLGTRFQWDSI